MAGLDGVDTREALPLRSLMELNELLWALPSSLDLQEIVAVLLERCTRLFEAPLAALWLRDGEGHVQAGCFGFTDKKAEQLWQRLELPAVGGRPLQLDGAALHALGGFGKRRMGALLALPMSTLAGAVGWLVFVRLEPEPFSDLERAFIEILASRMAIALANARQFQETHARSAELELLNEVASLLVSTTRLDDVLDRLARRMVETLDLTSCFVQLLDNGGPYLKLRAMYHRDPAQIESAREFLEARPLRIDEGRSAEIFRSQAPILVPNMAEDVIVPADVRDRLGSQGSVLILPLTIRGEFLGAMYLVRNGRGAPLDRESMPLATHLANQVSVAIANARLYGELEAKVVERTARFQQMTKELEDRMVAGRDFFTVLGTELCQRMQTLEDALDLIERDGDEAVRVGLKQARTAAEALKDTRARFVERMKLGDDLGRTIERS